MQHSPLIVIPSMCGVTFTGACRYFSGQYNEVVLLECYECESMHYIQEMK